MLQAISVFTGGACLSVDGNEFPIASLPSNLITEAELAVVRKTIPGSLPGYLCKIVEDDAAEDLGRN